MLKILFGMINAFFRSFLNANPSIYFLKFLKYGVFQTKSKINLKFCIGIYLFLFEVLVEIFNTMIIVYFY